MRIRTITAGVNLPNKIEKRLLSEVSEFLLETKTHWKVWLFWYLEHCFNGNKGFKEPFN